MASNNEFLLNVVTHIEKQLLELFDDINIKEQIEVVLRECGKAGLNSETKNILKYIGELSLSDKGNSVFSDYTLPAQEDNLSVPTEEPAAEEPAAEGPAEGPAEPVDQPVGPAPDAGTSEIEKLRQEIKEKEEQVIKIKEEPQNIVESPAQGSARRPEIVIGEREEKVRAIEEELEELRKRLSLLEEKQGGGKKKRTYKKKKRRSKKKRTPMKKKIK